MFSFIISFLVSLLICLLIIRYSHLHSHITSDPVKGGPQKFHTKPTPRIGGVAIFGGILAGTVIFFLQHKEFTGLFAIVLICALPLFLGGLAEDLTKKTSAKIRLILCIISAILAYFLVDAKIIRLDTILIDDLLIFLPISLIITTIAIAGVSNAINIIDGFNGLASGVSIIILTGLAYVAFKINDMFILFSCIVLIAAIIGFFVWNYPRGLIFLGDSGAYLIGFFIAVISVLIVKRNPQVSAWFPMLLVIYPVWETIFSVYRKKILRGTSPFHPDPLHLHMLVYKRILKWALGPKDAKYITRRNSATSVYLWGLTFIAFVPAVLFWQKTLLLQICTFLWILMYVWLYRKIVRFKIHKINNRKVFP
ncbi:MAG: glycosyltransferase [Thermodesulfovibrio sp.]|nr:glycosyltransferase [Thermodesulfovibrio sp.]